MALSQCIKYVLWYIPVAFLVLQGCTELPGPEDMNMIEIPGYTYTSFNSNGFGRGRERGALALLREQTASSWVALCVFEFQSTPHSSDIAPNTTGINPLTDAPWQTTSTMEDVRTGIGDAHANGFRVMLKPHVDYYSGGWRAAITPDDEGRWFAAYTAMMMKYARLAAETGVEMLCIGVEYATATQPKYAKGWEQLIDSVRTVFSGRLTYAANWSPAFSMREAELDYIPFWSRLDYAGVDFYSGVRTRDASIPASYIDIYAQMLARANRIEKMVRRTGRRVLLTEVGIQSVRGALAAPYDYARGNAPGALPDNKVQELYYRAILDAFGQKQWCAGFFWWNWESIPTATQATNYTAEGKPAAALLKRYYTGGTIP
jgi:hypothetical protein